MDYLNQELFELYTQLVEMDQKSRDSHKQVSEADRFTPCQIRYLQIIDTNSQLTSSEFAKLMKVSKPTVSQLINRFTTSECVYKQPSEEDRRICYIRLTPKGERIARAEQEARADIIKHIQERLTPEEIKTLIDLLDKLTD